MLEDIEQITPQISSTAKYWYMRTDGGDLYAPFISTNSIAIGYERVSLAFIKTIIDNENGKDLLKKEVKRLYPPVKEVKTTRR